jgi:hypothetical protein
MGPVRLRLRLKSHESWNYLLRLFVSFMRRVAWRHDAVSIVDRTQEQVSLAIAYV